MDAKYVGIFDAFFSFLMALLNNVLGNKIYEGGYSDSINGIVDAVKAAFAK